MRGHAPIVLALVVLAAGCGNDNTWDGRYKMDGQWEVWAAEDHNNCFMLSVGATYFVAMLESDASEVDYAFTGSDDGNRCWPRAYTRQGNQLLLEELDTRDVFVDPQAVCEVEIHRERVATFTSSDTFAEVSTVSVTWDPGGGCPPGPGDSCPEGKECCEARFIAAGVRCTGCWLACDAAAMTDDPELSNTLLDGGWGR